MTDPCDLCAQPSAVWLSGGVKLCHDHYQGAREWRRAVEDQALAEMGGPIPQRCPRRDEGMPRPGDGDEPDQWRFGHGLITDELLLTCNFCGSLHPDVFMQGVRQGRIVGPTDKNYKAYLAEPYTEAELAERRVDWENSRMGRALADAGEDLDAHWERNNITAGRDVGKFYFQHLSGDQRIEFVDLLNAKAMRIGYPGHFYRLPFFCIPR